MDDGVISTICFTPNKNILLQLKISEDQSIADVAKKCKHLLNNANNSFLDDEFVFINVCSNVLQRGQVLNDNYNLLLDVLINDDQPSITLSYRKNVLV